MVDTIYSLSNSLALYTNKNGAYIEFELKTELKLVDDRRLEGLLVNSRKLVVNQVNITEPYKIILVMRTMTEEDRDALAKANDTHDTSGIITIIQSSRDITQVKTWTYTQAVPEENHNFNLMLTESIKNSSVEVSFMAIKPEIRYE